MVIVLVRESFSGELDEKSVVSKKETTNWYDVIQGHIKIKNENFYNLEVISLPVIQSIK